MIVTPTMDDPALQVRRVRAGFKLTISDLMRYERSGSAINALIRAVMSVWS